MQTQGLSIRNQHCHMICWVGAQEGEHSLCRLVVGAPHCNLPLNLPALWVLLMHVCGLQPKLVAGSPHSLVPHRPDRWGARVDFSDLVTLGIRRPVAQLWGSCSDLIGPLKPCRDFISSHNLHGELRLGTLFCVVHRAPHRHVVFDWRLRP